MEPTANLALYKFKGLLLVQFREQLPTSTAHCQKLSVGQII